MSASPQTLTLPQTTHPRHGQRLTKVGRLWPEIEVHLPQERRVNIPDLVYLTTEHLNRYSAEEGRIHGTPDLVVEILSPSTERRDCTTKMRAYQRSGVTWY